MSNLITENFTEIIDKKILEKLLCNPDLLTSWTDENGAEHDDKKQLIGILQKLDGYKLSVKYNFSSNSKDFGRVYPEGSLSLGACQRNIRGTLTHGTYIDIDIVNAHPSMILHFLKKFEFPHSTYSKYINDRGSYLSKIMKTYSCSRYDAKKFFIVSGYGGSYNSWFNGLEIDKPAQSHESLFNLFQNEARLLAMKFVNSNNERYQKWIKKRTKKYNKDFGFLAVTLQDYERQILEVMNTFLTNEGLIKNNNAILCHDGIMIKRKSITTDTLKNMEKQIFKEMGFKLSCVNKPLEHYLDKLEDIKIIDEGKPINLNYFNELQTYDAKKKYFERYVCKIVNTSEFILLNISLNKGVKTYTHKIMSEKNLIIAFKHIQSHNLFQPEDVKKSQAPKPFINKWLGDSEMRFYLDVCWTPYNGTYKQTNTEIFNLFTGYSSAINGTAPDNSYDQIKPMLDVMLNLCEGEDRNLNYLVHFLAHIIQKPYEKLPFSIIFTGKQGTGKDTLLYAIGKIVGQQFINSESNLDNFLGTHAEGLVEKLLVAFNESDSSKTFNYEGVIKTLVSDDKLTVNRKYQVPYEIDNTARMFIFSNKQNPIKFDSVSSDRRFIAFKTTDKYADKKFSRWWGSFYKHMNTSGFIVSFYNYLNNIELSNFNFAKERLAVLTESYKEMARQQLPPIVDWVGDYISKFNEADCWNESLEEEEDRIWKDYLSWQNKFRPDTSKENGYVGDLRKFKSTVKHMGIPFDFKRGSYNRRFCKFTPSGVYHFLAKKNWIAGLDFLEESDTSDEIEFEF